MKAIKITIETDEDINLVLEGAQAEIAFNQIRWAIYSPSVSDDLRAKVNGITTNRYASPYAQYIAVHVPIGEQGVPGEHD
jgi:hypothetical protein